MKFELVDFLKNVCLPAKVYLALFFVNLFSVILIKKFYKRDFKVMMTALLIMIFVGLGVTWFGNYLCSQGYEVIPWLLVLLPFIAFVRNLRKLIYL